MKQTLLFLLFAVFSFAATAQVGGDCQNCYGNDDYAYEGNSATTISNKPEKNVQIQVYPNPATDYIAISEDKPVQRLAIFNLVGRQMREFEVAKGRQYPVADLPDGIYLIQLIDHGNQVITTHRISKRG